MNTKYSIPKDLIQDLRVFLKRKPYKDVLSVWNLLAKELLEAKELNQILDSIGSYPLEDVWELMSRLKSKTTKVEPAPDAEPETVTEEKKIEGIIRQSDIDEAIREGDIEKAERLKKLKAEQNG